MNLFGGLRFLKTQLAFILAVALLPAGVIAVLQALENAHEARDVRLALLQSEAQVRASEERDILIEIRESMRTTARLIAQSGTDIEVCTRTLAALETAHDWLTVAMVVDNEGNTFCSPNSSLGFGDLPEWAEFRQRDQFSLGVPKRGRLTGNLVIPAFYPIFSSDPELTAVVVGVRVEKLKTLADFVGAEVRAGMDFALIGNEGTVLAADGVRDFDWLPADKLPLRGLLPRTLTTEGQDGKQRHFISHPLIADQVWAVTAVPPAPLSEVILSNEVIAIVSPIVLWAIAVTVAAVAINRLVTRHVVDLQRIASRIGRGDLDTPIRSFDDAPFEIKRLGDSIRAMATNLSERDGRLRDLLDTQKSLLLEVHHRVKNNLQMISSLVNIQQRRATDAHESRALQLVQDRIHGLALVHQNLYTSERLDHVALDHLLGDLCGHLGASLGAGERAMAFDMNMQEVVVDADIATPVALFLTEALGNAFKHAGTGGGQAQISIHLTADDTEFRLGVWNPAAPPAAPAETAPGSGAGSGLGLRLMEGFARQLGGRMERHDDNGRFGVEMVAPIKRRTPDTAFRVRNRAE